jgi:hypothetical protein
MDWTKDQGFQHLLSRLDGIITAAARLKHPDGKALDNRRRGVHNLQGHANALEPLAALLFQESPILRDLIRERTALSEDMGPHTREARDSIIRDAIAGAITDLRATRGSDIISREMQGLSPITVDSACDTYLSTGLGGGQSSGGAGDTVVKRVLKLLAHMS